MAIKLTDAEREYIAQQFHAHYEEFAPAFGYETREASAVAWEAVPQQNKQLMLHVVQKLVDAEIIDVGALTRRLHAGSEVQQPTPTEDRLAKIARRT